MGSAWLWPLKTAPEARIQAHSALFPKVPLVVPAVNGFMVIWAEESKVVGGNAGYISPSWPIGYRNC